MHLVFGSLKVKFMNTRSKQLLCLWVSLAFAMPCSAQNWERFRGSNGDGYVADAQLPTTWTDDDYSWKVELAGGGASSPVVWGDRIFVLSSSSDAEIFLQCLNLENGEELWKKDFQSEAYRIHQQNNFASSSPAVDADHVYITYANPEHTVMVALDHDGNEVWKRDFGTWTSQHGFGASPMVYKDLVIFCNSQQAQRLRASQTPGKSEVIAVNRETGEDVWRTPLTATRACYAMLCVFQAEGQPDQLIGSNTGNGFYSIDPKSGELNWSSPAFDMRTVASTYTSGDMVYGSNGTGGGGNYLVAARPGPEGVEEVFRVSRNANYVPSPIAVGELLFLFGDKGVVSCVDRTTGDEHWRARVGRGFSGSPVANSTHVYCIDQQGTLHVIKASEKYDLVSSIGLGEPSRATPAIVGNRLLLRTANHLMAISGKE